MGDGVGWGSLTLHRMEISGEDLRDRLTPEALELLRQMAAAHLESSGDRLFISADSIAGTELLFTGDGSTREFKNFDGGALQDLTTWGLLHLAFGGRGTPNYRVSAEGLRFYRWLLDEAGSPVDQLEQDVRRTIDSASFSEAHPGGAHHLREAFALLWEGRTDDQVVSEIGDHLRKSLMDVASDVVGAAGEQERPVQRLGIYIDSRGLSAREAEVARQLVEFVRVVLRLDHRLNHIRDEADQGEPETSWDEIRRAAFTTAFACSELDRLSRR